MVKKANLSRFWKKKKNKNLYRFFVGKQFLPDLVKVLSILPQSLDKLFLNEKNKRRQKFKTDV